VTGTVRRFADRRRALVAALLAGVLVLAGAAWLLTHRRASAAAGTSFAPNVGIATVRFGAFSHRVVAEGRIGPPAGSSAKVAFAQSGIVRAVDVRVGERVAAGAVLAELDRSALGAAVDQAGSDAAAAAGSYGGGAVPAAAVRSAQAKLALAAAKLRTLQAGGPAAQSDQIAAQQSLRQAQLKVQSDESTVARQRTLFSAGVVAAKDVQAAENQLAVDQADLRAAQAKVAAAGSIFAASLRQATADYASAQNDLATATAQATVLGAQSGSARARLDAARIAYENGILRSPSGGIVIAILKHAGEAVDPTAPVVEIGPGAADAITLSVPADTAERIRVGDPATLDTNAMHGAAGRVTAVVPAIDPTTQSATVTVVGNLAGAVPGDAVTATIVVDHRRGLLVPSTAIVQDPQTGATVVFARKPDGSFESRSVTVAGSDDTTALVSGGVRAGDRVASQGSYQLLAPSGGG
jgi:multidrug efflux pump subunit AcrA (membrane-fusion protein)